LLTASTSACRVSAQNLPGSYQSTGDSARSREVEVAGVTDDEGVELLTRASEQPELRDREPRRRGRTGLPVVAATLPD